IHCELLVWYLSSGNMQTWKILLIPYLNNYQ
ncbi:hypothetical protein GCK32_013545, partial [Trichostrongylus colubriformis]